LAVPSGYVWAREIDPNAGWDPQNQIVTAAGQTYKPGEYYLENGRAYIPNPIPEGYQWVRSYFAPGQVSYDEKTRTVNLPGGLSIPQSQLVTIGGRTYAPASQLAQMYQTYAATYKPPEPTAEDVKRKSDAMMQVYSPLMEAVRSRLNLNLKNIQAQADQQQRLAEAAYQSAQSNLQRRETGSWNTIMKSALARGLGASPLTSYEQRQVAEAYAPEYQQLETERATQLANIASQAAMAADELAQQGQEQEAQWASQLAQYAYNALQSDAAAQKQAVQSLADYSSNLATSQAQAQQEAQELQLDLYKDMLPYMYPTANALVPYQYGPTPYQQGQLQLSQSRLAQSAAEAASKNNNVSSTEAKQANLAMLYGSIADRYRQYADRGYGGQYAVEQLTSELEADRPTLLRSGLSVSDINSLKDYIYSLAGIAPQKPMPWDYYQQNG
jgi:hypothetical protein